MFNFPNIIVATKYNKGAKTLYEQYQEIIQSKKDNPNRFCQACGKKEERRYFTQYQDVILCPECNTEYLGFKFCMKELKKYDEKAQIFRIILETDQA